MKVALTGSSSTGKTTLALCLHTDATFLLRIPHYITTDAGALLRSLGHSRIDSMQAHELRRFRECYFAKKTELEFGRDNYLTDRSFVDVAAYWIELDAANLSAAERRPLVEQCRRAATIYDLHVYCPFGQIPFARNNCRLESVAFHERIDRRIRVLLRDWGCRVVPLDVVDLADRVNAVKRAVSSCLQ